VGDEGQTATRVHGDDAPTQMTPLAPPSRGGQRAAVPIGKKLGKYVVERTIGQGGMGIVVAARHEHLGEAVAIKLLHPKAAVDKIQVERFVREARATARIKSEHVVRVLDAGEEDGTNAPFIVMEYLHGRDVGRMLTESGPLAMQLAVDIMIQVCEAAAGAHALGIVHRDLKPSNFFVTTRADGTPLVKVLDFGISKAAQQDGTVDPRLTETQAVFGSPTYMSPEQIRSSKNVDSRSDVWSLGVALFEMLSAKLPFIADNVPGLLASIVADEPFRLITFNADVPDGLEAIVLACLEKDPTKRIQSAGELAIRLSPFASPEGQHLAQRIDRMVSMRGSSPSSHSFPPPPPSGSRASLPPVAPLPPLSRAPPPISGQGVVFGTTEGDLGTTEPALRVRRNNAKIAIVFVGLAVAGIAAGIAVVTVGSGKPSATPSTTSSSKSAAAPPPTVVIPPAPIVIAPPPPASAAVGTESPAPAASGASSAGGKRGKSAGGRNAHGSAPANGNTAAVPGAAPATATPSAPAPGTAKPPSATDDRF